MNPAAVTTELDTIRRRTRRLTGVSVLAHVLLFMAMLFYQKIAPEEMAITEITWLDPLEVAPAAAAPAEPEPIARVEQKPAPNKAPKHFERLTREAEVAPKPQDVEVVEDRISQRLASLQQNVVRKPTDIAALTTPTAVKRPSLAGVSSVERRSPRPSELTRKESKSTGPLELKRSPIRTQKATVAMPSMPDTRPSPAQSQRAESTARRTLAGASMSGPVADRPLVSYETPRYPEWAKEEAVEGSVHIYFVVLPNGHVKENVMIQKTSGFEDFDKNATSALLAWRFEPLTAGTTGEQWGTITFHYRLGESN